jgi:hypothetical protein
MKPRRTPSLRRFVKTIAVENSLAAYGSRLARVLVQTDAAKKVLKTGIGSQTIQQLIRF